MFQTIIAVIALAALVFMSHRANRRFRDQHRLPMQWSFSGSVNWSAPRALALAFTPLLAGIVLPAATLATIVVRPRSGQEGLEVPVIAVLSLGFVAIHALHLRLIGRTVRGSER